MNILVVEDDPSVRTLVKAILEHNGNHVTTEDTVADGERATTEGSFEMIILDLGLPDGDGYELCKSISYSLGRWKLLRRVRNHPRPSRTELGGSPEPY